MISKLGVLGFAFVSAVSAQAAAHDGYGDSARGGWNYPDQGAAQYRPVQYRPGQYRPAAAGYQPYEGSYAADLRHADYNNDGRVTMAEARAYARRSFARADFDRNGVVTRREVRGPGAEFARDDRNRDGVVTYAEYAGILRQRFERLDTNRDGVLSPYERGERPPPGMRRPGWRR
jgi:EF hand domain-containing protein